MDDTLKKDNDSIAVLLSDSVDDNPFRLDDEEISQAIEAIKAQDSDTVHQMLDDLGPADIAELLHKMSADVRHEFLQMFSEQIAPETYSELNYELRRNVLENMDAEDVARILSDLDSDDALDIIEDIDPDFRKQIISKLSAKTRLVLEEGLSFPEDSAGRLMQREVVAVPEFWTVGKAIDYLRSAGDSLPNEFFDVIVVDPAYHVTGIIPLKRIICSHRPVRLEDLKLDVVYSIPAEMDQEEVADIFRRDNLLSAPVVDDNGRLLGVITIDDIIDVIDEETQEDIMRLGGVTDSDLYTSPMRTSVNRMRWLAITLVNTIIASFVISRFEATIEEIVALAILMPIVAAMGGNAGMQVVTVTVRGLATRELSSQNYNRIIKREILVGALNGVVFGCIMGLLAALWFGSPVLGMVLMAAMLFNMFWAGIAGTGIPLILERFGYDPALSAGPFLTTTTDCLGFLIFLGLATLVLL
ncbi:MAG: magnesium transporter [Alphaproteobacteria bacterium]